MKKHLIIIRGAPGSGKTTLALEILKNGIADYMFEADDYFRKSGAYLFDAKKLADAHSECRDSVRQFLGNGFRVIVSNTTTTWKEIRPFLDLAYGAGASVSVITMEDQFQNIHGVPEDKVQIMRERMFDASFFFEQHKQVYGVPFEGEYIEHGKDDLCRTMQALRSKTSSPEKLNT